MAPDFSLYNDDEDELNFGLGDLDASLGYGLDFGGQPALASAIDDESQGFGVATPFDFNKSRGLIDSTTEIQQERIRKLTERALNPNYQLSPGQAFATTALSILPTVAGYLMGGPELAAKTSQLDGGSAFIKGLQETDKQERAAAMQAAQLESQNLRQTAGSSQEMVRFLMAQQQRQDLQNQRTAAQRELQGQRLESQKNVKAEQRNWNQKEYEIPGLETDPNDILNSNSQKKGQELYGQFGSLEEGIKDLKRKILDPAASLDSQRASYYRLVDLIKTARGYGANFSAFEQTLAQAGLPGIGDYTSPSSVSDTVLSKLRGLDPIAKLDELSAANKREFSALLKPYKYYLPGTLPKQESSSADLSGYDPLTRLQIQAESSGNPNAVSPKGAYGLMQLTEPAVRDVARALGIDEEKAIQLSKTNKNFNVFVGQTYKDMMRQRYGGDEDKANAAYNAGPGAVDKYGGVPPYKETQDYVSRLKSRREELLAKRGTGNG